MIRSHRIRLNPTPKQQSYFVRAAGTRRFVYNWGLAEWKRQYAIGGKPSIMALKKQFNAIKRDQFPWVYEVSKCVAEGAFMDLKEAFTGFFEKRSSGKKVGYPRFKSKKHSRDGFYIANDKFRVKRHSIWLPHIGQVNMAESLRLEGRIQSARITRSGNWWFVSIAVAIEREAWVHEAAAVGIDVGVNRLATLSDGSVLENQKPLKSLMRRVNRLNRSLRRKQVGSKNREKTRLKLSRLHYRIACLREDTLQKTTTAIANRYQFVAIEDLNVMGLMRNHKMAQALADVAIGQFLTLLEQKVAKRGGVVRKIGRFYPSSKTCSSCGAIRDTLPLHERTYVCTICGANFDRDYNAAVNILNEAWRLHTGNQ